MKTNFTIQKKYISLLGILFIFTFFNSCSKKEDANNTTSDSKGIPSMGILYVGDTHIWVMDTSGNNARKLSLSQEWIQEDYPSSSPDGKKVVFTRYNVGIIIMDNVGEKTIRDYTNTPIFTTWSYNSKIYFSRYNGAISNGKNYIYSINTDGTNETQASPLFNEIYDPSDDHPSISPDGLTMLFSHNRFGNGGVITKMTLSNSSVSNLTNTGTTVNTPDDIIKPSEYPTWSPNGSKIAFAAYPGYPNYSDKEQIYIMNADGSGKTVLTNETNASCNSPSWSPDGNKIVFQKNFPYWKTEIWVMNADGTHAHALTNRNITGFEKHPCFIGKPL